MRTLRILSLPPALLGVLAASALAAPSLGAAAPPPSHPPTAVAAAHCGDRYGQFNFGRAHLLVLHVHGVPCSEARTLARQLARHGTPLRRDGYRCTRDRDIQAGGGAARCVRGRQSVEFGFE